MKSSSLPQERQLPIRIGCAGWSVASSQRHHFPEQGSHLERYAQVLPAVEINTSFYRPHRPETYAKWRDSVPDGFRFSVKIPRTITHEQRLHACDDLVASFLSEVHYLGPKLGCLLVQLPPSLRFVENVAQAFFLLLKSQTGTPIVCEPRHVSWFSSEAQELLHAQGIAYVFADPPAVNKAVPTAALHTVYIRLHGSPEMYYSSYSQQYLSQLAVELRQYQEQGKQVWCIFDNTASGAALPNALSLLGYFEKEESVRLQE